MPTNVKDVPQDARDAASKRVNAALDKFRQIGNSAAWALTSDEREAMAVALENGVIEVASILRGTGTSGTEFNL